MSVLSSLRNLLHGSAQQRAIDAEAETLDRYAAHVGQLEATLHATYGAHPPGTSVHLGRAIEWDRDVRLLLDRLRAHALLVGPSGCGKSRAATTLIKTYLESGIHLLVLDPKAETVELSLAATAMVLRQLAPIPRAREALLSRLVLIDLFGGGAVLPRLNVLAPVPGLDEESHAFQIALLLTAELDQGVGVRQEAILCRVVECLLRARLPLTVLPVALSTPLLLERLAETCGPADLFKTTAQRLRRESKERILGLESRAERVLRLKATRLALGAPDCIDFEELLGVVGFVNLAPPQGAADIARVLSGLLWIGLSQAIRRRPNGAPRTHLIIDEFSTFLSAGGPSMVDGIEDLLRLARSKSVYLTGALQDLASIGKLSATLPEQLRTNIHLWMCFRSLSDTSYDFLLPVTGRRPRAAPAPWEENRGGFLERSAEVQLLRSRLSQLADRECFIADRRTGLPGVWMRTADLTLDASVDEIAAVEAAARQHPMLSSVNELEQAQQEVATRVAALLGVRDVSVPTEERPALRRARNKLDIG